MSTIRKFIVVDDDPFNNILSNLAIESALGDVEIKTFACPEEGLQFIENEYPNSMGPTILFLDINMPTLTAWEFIEKFEMFSDPVKKQIHIYILSSSVDHRDKDKAKGNKYVEGFISKPLENDDVMNVAAR